MPTLASPSREDYDKVKAHIASVLKSVRVALDHAIRDLQDLQDGMKGETAVLGKSWLPDQTSRYKTSVTSRQAGQNIVDEHNIKKGTLAAASRASLLEAPKTGCSAITDNAKKSNCIVAHGPGSYRDRPQAGVIKQLRRFQTHQNNGWNRGQNSPT